MSYWRLFYHVVWGTKHRTAIIDNDRADVIERSIRASCHDMQVIVHAIGFMPDHVHIAISSPPRLALASVLQRIKGESSHLLNHSARASDENWFAWQPEYGVMTFDEESLSDVVAYVKNQREGHKVNELWADHEIIELEPRSLVA